MSNTLITVVFALSFVLGVTAESHTVRFVNNCGRGTPQLIQGGNVLSSGEDFVSNGPINSAIAYLQDGSCLFNGEHCSLLETNMNNPTCPGCGSSSDISLITPHAFNVGVAFEYFGGTGNTCDGLGAVCTTANCNTAFFQPDDTFVQRACQSDNVGLLITFCPSGTTRYTEAVVGSLSGGSGSGSSKAPSASSSKPAAVASSTPPASKPSSAPSVAKPSSIAVPVNVGAASSITSETLAATSATSATSATPTAASPASTRTCSRRKLSRKRSPTPGSRRAHKRSQAIAHGLVHKKF